MSGKGTNIIRVFNQRRCGETERIVRNKLRDKVCQRRPLVNSRRGGLEADSLTQSEEIDAAYANREAWSETRTARWILKTGYAAANSCNLSANPDVQRVMTSFINVVENILIVFLTIRVLNRSIDAGEDT